MSEILEKLFSLKGKRALITGASGGIGGALAQGLADAGATVIINGTSREKLEAVRESIKKDGGEVEVVQGDLQTLRECRRIVSKAASKSERLDILINCAGVNRRKPARDVSEDDYEFITSINLKSVFFLCQAAYSIMKKQGGGKVINVGSITSTDGLGGVSVYGMTKAGVAQLTKTLALEWARDNIQVNCLAPGFIHTPLTAKGLWGDSHRRKWILERVPAGRGAQPEELVGATLLLASQASSYLTGQIINVDGGYLCGGSWLKEDE